MSDITNENHEITIDGVRFYTSKYKAFTGIKIFRKLLKLCKKSIATVMEQIDKGQSLLDSDATVFVTTIVEGLTDLSDNEFEEVILQILSATLVQTKTGPDKIKKEDVDSLFQGKYLDLINLLKEVLIFQFKDFLSDSEIASRFKKAISDKKMAEQKLAKEQGSTKATIQSI